MKNAKDSVELESRTSHDHGVLENVLQIPKTKVKKMRLSQLTEEDYREKLVEYYISIYPLASWNYVAGNINYYGQFGAYDKVKGNVKIHEGMPVVGDTY